MSQEVRSAAKSPVAGEPGGGATSPGSSAAQGRCGNTIHSDYVTDHRCQLPRGHSGDCLFGAPAWALLRAFEDLPVRRSTGYTVVMERGPLDAWRAKCGELA